MRHFDGAPLRSLRERLTWISLALVASACVAAAQNLSPAALDQIRYLMAEKEARTSAQKKIDSQLNYGRQLAQGAAIGERVPSLTVDERARPDAQGMFLVDVTGTVGSSLVSAIAAAGGQVTDSWPAFDSLRARIPLAALETIAGRADVKFIRPAERPMTSGIASKAAAQLPRTDRAARVRSQLEKAIPALYARRGLTARLGAAFALIDVTGDKAHRADAVRALGYDGTGVKVGVLSDGVDPLATMQAAGDLPAVTVLSGQAGSGAEGTAMLQIVYNLAPGAQLYFARGGPSQAQFATNILNLRAAGCDIIVDDITFFAEGVFQDGTVAKAVNTVVTGGALYFSSAGNEGRLSAGTSGTWEGDFVDSGTTLPGIPAGVSIHNFGGVNNNLITQDAQAGTGFWLKWSDPLGASSNDYDFYMLNGALTAVVAASTNPQTGTQDPFEFIGCAGGATCGRAGNRLVVVRNAGAQTRALNLANWRARLARATTGCTFGHNAGANTISVAAVNVATAGGGAFTGGAANPVETYSCDGPRRIFYDPSGNAITPGNVLFSTNGGTSLMKPDIAAADCTPATAPGFPSTFCGTSAAAPHSAALAALIKSAKPALTPGEIRAALNASALDIMAAGVDIDSGVGIVMGLGAVQSLTTPVTIQSAPPGLTFTISGAGCPAGNHVTPFASNWPFATSCVVTFPSPQALGAIQYAFVSWADGSAANPRTITTPQAETTFTANFVQLVLPPVISKAFAGPTVPLNGTTTLTFNIVNPNPGAALSGVGFTDALPSGLAVATPNGLTGSCGAGTITAVAGSGSIGLTGGTIAAGGSCTFSVKILGRTEGVWTNKTTAVTSAEGGPGNIASAAITVAAPPRISKSFSLLSIPVGSTSTLSFTIQNPNATVALTVGFTDALPAGLVVATPPVVTGSCGGGTITAVAGAASITLAGGVLPAGGSCSFSVNVAGAAAGTQTNSVTVQSVEGGPGNTATAVITVGDPFLVSYAANLNSGDSLIDLTNPGTNGGNICANVYAFSPDEQMVSCCSCVVTPDALVSLSVRGDLIINTLTPAVPNSIVVKLVGTTGTSCNAANLPPNNLAAGMSAWGATLHAAPAAGTFGTTETPFVSKALSVAEAARLSTFCGYIQANGSGYGICRSCRQGGQGAERQ